MENVKTPTSIEVVINGGSGDYNVVVYDNVTDQFHTFKSVKNEEILVASLYFGERVVLKDK